MESEGYAVLFGILSVILLVTGFLAAPLIVARLPVDYFCDDGASRSAGTNPKSRLLSRLAKNLLAICLVAAGVAMLVLPGQGLLTIFAGLLLLDFPGKRKIILRVYQRPRIRRALDWMRRKMKREPFRQE